MPKRDRLYSCHISTLPLSSCGHWNSHLWAFLCVNPPHAARMPTAPRLTPCPQHFDGSPTQSLIHRVLAAWIWLIVPLYNLSAPAISPSLFRPTIFFYTAFICFLSFSHIISPFSVAACWPSSGTVCVCVCVCWPGSCKRRQLRELTRCDSSGYLSLALTVDRWIPLTHCKE